MWLVPFARRKGSTENFRSLGSRKRALIRIIHESPSRNHRDASRDGRAEILGAEAYSKQYVEAARGEPARLAAGNLAAKLVGAAYRRLQ